MRKTKKTPATNASGEEIPPFAAVRITGSVKTASGKRFTINKPNSSTEQIIAFNGETRIAIGSIGAVTLTPGAMVLGSGAAGTKVGPTNDSWLLSAAGVFDSHVSLGEIGGGRIAAKAAGGGGKGSQTGVAIITNVAFLAVADFQTADESDTLSVVTNPHSIALELGDQVLLEKNGDDWEILAVLEDPQLSLVELTAELLSSMTFASVGSWLALTGDVGSGSTILNPLSLTGVVEDKFFARKTSGTWYLVAKLEGGGGEGNPVIPAVAITTIAAATYDNASMTPTTTGTIKLVDADGTYGDAITDIKWISKSPINGTTAEPVALWVQLVGTTYHIISKDGCGE